MKKEKLLVILLIINSIKRFVIQMKLYIVARPYDEIGYNAVIII